MHLYNITWSDTVNPKRLNQSCHINADDISDLHIKFKEKYPTGFIWGLVIVDN